MIIETIISTIDKNGKVNFAPFGIKKEKKKIFISPYIPSKTLDNLKLTKCAVINYTNDSRFFVNCIVGEKNFEKKKCKMIKNFFLDKCQSYDEVLVEEIIDHEERPTFVCKVIYSANRERFDGHNRAKSSLIEACILASRVNLIENEKIINELDYLSISIDKTAGDEEKKSWAKIYKYIKNKMLKPNA